VARAFAAPHAATRQGCHGGQPRRAWQTWARACRAGACGVTALPRHTAWRDSAESTGPVRPPFFLLSSLSSLPAPSPRRP
jgi:hypothetical protein